MVGNVVLAMGGDSRAFLLPGWVLWCPPEFCGPLLPVLLGTGGGSLGLGCSLAACTSAML